ncbi:hypothetical protein ANCDUO_05662 [Ancylostoma duodenale]|uniref:Calcium binding EGF domain protein n=1 Tax=Ancylostoma duodenale TaxID=51022 RepID=A0A0C2GRW9_9BILA|nr:hypothetical protein ANCDUO_05662 [Ancylostoma duodenale]
MEEIHAIKRMVAAQTEDAHLDGRALRYVMKDECELDDVCPSAQPDCLNTPGSYLCICFEYDEENKRCKGSKSAQHLEEKIPVQIVPVQPSFGRTTAAIKPPALRNRFVSTTQRTTTTAVTTTRQPTTVL